MNLRELFLRHVAQTSDAPIALEIVQADGCTLTAADGRTYLDLIGGISVCNVGHRHPRVVKAIKDQADRYLHLLVYGEMVETPQVEFAQALVRHLPASLDCVYFTNSGAEAVEGAMKLAKRVTGRTGIVSFQQSYHGSTQGALSVMGDEYWRNAYRPLLPDVDHLRYGVHEDLARITDRTACVIAETVQAEAGVFPPEASWLKALRKRCDDTGALLILDEIQVGFGRTGTLWGFEAYDIVPDILLLGKALGGGMPLGAFISSRERMWMLTHDPVLGHITTFGGHPVCCAAGLAGFHALLDEGMMGTVKEKESLFHQLLKHPRIKQVRSAGLLMAAEFHTEEECRAVIKYCLTNGLLTDWFLFAPNCLRIAPPLTINNDQIKDACAMIVSACTSI